MARLSNDLFEVRVSQRPDKTRTSKLPEMRNGFELSDLDEIVETFKLNIDRIAPERLQEIVGLLDAVPKTRLNAILDRVEEDALAMRQAEGIRNQVVRAVIKMVREEIQK